MLSPSFLESLSDVTTSFSMPYQTPDKIAGTDSPQLSIPAWFTGMIVGILLGADNETMWEIRGDATIEECLDELRSVIAQIEEV